jgi:type II secretory pathway component PulF
MAVFQYTAMTADGRQQTGTVTADNRVAAMASVESMGLYPTALDDAATAAPKAVHSKDFKGDLTKHRIKPQVTLEFFRQLSNLLTAGVSLSKALQILGRETSNAGAKAMWRSIHEQVSDGASLAAAMATFPRTFPAVYVAMVRAGEAGGFLDVVLRQIADFMSRERELKSRVTAAMVYPIVLACIAVGVVIFLLSWFIPRFSEIFSEFGESLPLLTRIIQTASLAVRDYGLFIAVGVLIVVIAARKWMATQAGRRWRDEMLPRLPGIGTVVTRFALVRFTRMLGTLVGAGVPLITALRVAREAVGNQMLSDALTTAISQVQEGISLAKSLSACTELFPVSVVEMIAVAEESGKLDAELVRMAAEFESDLDRRLRVLVALAEPALLFVMAAVVGTIVIGMLLPVFDLWDAIK